MSITIKKKVFTDNINKYQMFVYILIITTILILFLNFNSHGHFNNIYFLAFWSSASLIMLFMLTNVVWSSSFEKDHGGIINIFSRSTSNLSGYIAFFFTVFLFSFIISSLLKYIFIFEGSLMMKFLYSSIAIIFAFLILSTGEKISNYIYTVSIFLLLFFISFLAMIISNINLKSQFTMMFSNEINIMDFFSDYIIYMVFFIFIISFMVNEIKDPEEEVPNVIRNSFYINIIYGLLFFLLLILTSSSGIISYEKTFFGAKILYILNSFLIIIFISIIMKVLSKCFHKMSEDRLFFVIFEKTNKEKVPYSAYIVLFLIIGFHALFIFSNLNQVFYECVKIGSIIMFSWLSLSLFLYRNKFSEKFNVYTLKISNFFLIVLSILSLLLLIYVLSRTNYISYISYLIIYTLIFTIICFIFNFYYNESFRIDLFSILYRNNLKKNISTKEIKEFAENKLFVNNGKILLYGIGSISFLKQYKKNISGFNGKIYIVSNSKTGKNNIDKYIEKNLSNCKIHTFLSVPGNLDTRIPKVDYVICINILNNYNDPTKILVELNKTIKNGKQIVFFERNSIFNYSLRSWMRKNDVLTKFFSDSGFRSNIQKKNGLFSSDIMIILEKSEDAQYSKSWVKL